MRWQIKVVAASSALICTMLILALEAIAWWESHVHSTQELVESPYELWDPVVPGITEALYSIASFILLFGLAVLWEVAVVFPSILLTRRFVINAIKARYLALAAVTIISAIVFATCIAPHHSLPLGVLLAIGGTTGIAAALLSDRMLPPNNRFERSRGASSVSEGVGR